MHPVRSNLTMALSGGSQEASRGTKYEYVGEVRSVGKELDSLDDR